jgi:alanyl-tRNA synthetase
VHNTADVGMLLMTQEGSLSTGVRRMEAMAGQSLQNYLLKMHKRVDHANTMIAEDTFSYAGADAALISLIRICEGWKHTEQAIHALGLKVEEPDFVMPHPMAWRLGVCDLLAAQQLRDLCDGLTQILNSKPTEVTEIADRYQSVDCGLLANIAAIQRARRANERLIETAKQQLASSHVDSLAQQCKNIAGISVLCAYMTDLDVKDLRALSDELRNRVGSGVYCLAAGQTGKVSLLVAVTSDLVDILPASQLIAAMAPCIGGRGGGKQDLAQAGGIDAEGIPVAFAKLEALVANR